MPGANTARTRRTIGHPDEIVRRFDMKVACKSRIVALVLTAVLTPALAADNPPFDTAKIDQITGLQGKYNQEERVYKITKPRTDVKVKVDG